MRTPQFAIDVNDVIARDGRRNRKLGRDHGTKMRRSREGNCDLSNDEGEHAGKNGHNDRSTDACATVNRIPHYRKCDEKWQRKNSEGEYQPAEQAYAKHIENESEDQHGGGPATMM